MGKVRAAATTVGFAALVIWAGLHLDKSSKPSAGATVILLSITAVGFFFWLLTAEPVRHRIPGFQPKSLPVRFSLDGSEDLTVRLRPKMPQTVLLEVGVVNPKPKNIEGVSVNMIFPEGLEVERVDQDGVPRSGGHWLKTPERFPDEPAPGRHKVYWVNDDGIVLPGSGNRLFIFKLRFSEPGEYHIASELFGNVKGQRDYEKIVVTEADEADHRGLIGEAIYDGEAMRDGKFDDAFSGSAIRDDFGAWVIQYSMAVPDDPALRGYLDAKEPKSKGDDEKAYRIAQIEATLPRLYEIRRRLARAEASS